MLIWNFLHCPYVVEKRTFNAYEAIAHSFPFDLKSCCFFFSSSNMVEMATELFHWQLYEMHFTGRNICTSNQILVQLVNPSSPGWYGNDFKNAIAEEYILRIKCMSMSDEIALCWMPPKTFMKSQRWFR